MKIYRIRLRLLEYVGRNIAIIMGFNYAANRFVRLNWKKIPALEGVGYNWYIDCLLVFLVCLFIMAVWSLLKKLFPKIAISTAIT